MDIDPLRRASGPPGPLAAPKAWIYGESTLERAEGALSSGWGLGGLSLELIAEGRVNQSFRVLEGGMPRYVLQRLNPALECSEAMAWSWSQAGEALSVAKLGCPEMVKTADGRFLLDSDGELWRLTRFLEGREPEAGSLSDAQAIGKALGLAHGAWNRPSPLVLTSTIDSGEVTNQRLCLRGDFELIEKSYKGHPSLAAALPEIKRGAAAAAALPMRPAFVRVFSARDLVIHKDTKRTNFLLGRRVSIIDLDTVGYGDPLIDLGEALRSGAASARPGELFSAPWAAAFLDGYRSAGPDLGKEDFKLIPTVVRAICVNLARRYLTDSLAELHFKWDKDNYPSLHLQNLSRGARCLDLADELLDREFELMSL
ncbi:MAG: phosphotransferase [Deltaproteobacteria bacterium]|jgi:Ser/Thr protein kinase RdoA (MazF antagonist)|nr:phosphotransferase [Deltaproteobacteria bacterium]